MKQIRNKPRHPAIVQPGDLFQVLAGSLIGALGYVSRVRTETDEPYWEVELILADGFAGRWLWAEVGYVGRAVLVPDGVDVPAVVGIKIEREPVECGSLTDREIEDTQDWLDR